MRITVDPMEVTELRAAERYVSIEPLVGSYGAASVLLLDIGERGAQIEHAQPLRLGTTARLWFKWGHVTVSLQAVTVWSHLSKKPNDKGKYLYHSGLRIEHAEESLRDALRDLASRGVLKLDVESMERKRQRLLDKQRAMTGHSSFKVLNNTTTQQQALLIQHARERLNANPDEAAKWYNRAKFALTQDNIHFAGDAMRHREDVLAVWEYLERSVPLAEVMKAFEKKEG